MAESAQEEAMVNTYGAQRTPPRTPPYTPQPPVNSEDTSAGVQSAPELAEARVARAAQGSPPTGAAPVATPQEQRKAIFLEYLQPYALK